MRYIPAPDDFDDKPPRDGASDNSSDSAHTKAMARVWQWALDEDQKRALEQQVAAENRAAAEFTGDSFEDLFKPHDSTKVAVARPRAVHPGKVSDDPRKAPFMRLVTD